MSQPKEKFCEECGKTSPIEVKYCKFCGIEFPAIDHPDYVRANAPAYNPALQEQFPNQYIPPPVSDVPPQSIQPPQYVPQQPMQSQEIPQSGYSRTLMRKPPRAWFGGGIIRASKSFYSNPVESAPGLIEDPQAPNSFWIVLFTAVSSALVQYFTYLKTDFTEQIGEPEFLDTYSSSQGIQNSALQVATFSFLLQIAFWFFFSWLLARTTKNGLPQDSYLLHTPSKSMRQLTGFLYIPTLFRNISQIILLQFENDREAKIKNGQDFLSNETPEITYLTSFSDQYLILIFVIALTMAIITAFTFYRSIKIGLRHNGSSPAMIAFLIIGFTLLIYPPFWL